MTTAFGPQGPNFATVRPPFDPNASGGIDTWYKNCSAAGAKDGTYATADWFNVLIDQLRTLVVQSGVPLDGTNSLMLFQAVAALAAKLTALDAGTANTLAFTIPTPAAGFVTGLAVDVKKSALANTGAVSAIVNTRAAVPVVWADGTAIAAGDWPSNAWARLVYDDTNPAAPFWALTSFPGIDIIDTGGGGGGGGGTPAATPQAMSLSGNTTVTVPTGYTSMVVELWGGGGGGGASLANGAGGTGGGSGAHAVGQYAVVAGQTYTATVGAGGAINVNANGGTGGASSLGALLSATGGTGGAVCGGGAQTVVGNGGTATGGTLANDPGFPGGQSGGAVEMIAGPGGCAPFGGAGGFPSGGLGCAGAWPAGGGGGGSNAQQGGAGAPGRILITFYA